MHKRLTSNRVVIFIIAVMLAAGLFAGCGSANVPEKHFIPCPPDYPTAEDEYGADAYDGMLDDTDSRFYKIADYYNASPDDEMHILEHFETYQQTTEYTCGAASALMVLNYFGLKDYDEMLLAEKMNANETSGITVEGMRDFFLDLGWNVEANADTQPVFADVKAVEEYLIKKIDDGVPVLVNWEDWGGHWQVIIGIDTGKSENPYDDTLVLADPYDITDHYQDGYYTFSLGRFYTMWREGACAGKEIPYEQPYVTARPAV